MSKRFTETGKWRDKWFLTLSAEHKLAWLFVCDECDHAGVIEIVEPLANMQIGAEVDWQDFVAKCAYRIVDLGNGKFWVRAFIGFQYGTLNPENRVHSSVLQRLEKMGLPSPLQGPSKGLKNKDKDSGTKKEKGATDPIVDAWSIPDSLDCDEVRKLLGEFEAMRLRERKPIKSRRETSKVLKHFDSQEHLIYALETCIANTYQGLKPDYQPPKKWSNDRRDRNGDNDSRGNLALRDQLERENLQNGV